MRKLNWLLAALLLVATSIVMDAPQWAQAQATPENCTLAPDLLDGQGFSVGGQGFSVGGQGFSVGGQGFSVGGQGFSVGGQGFSVGGQGFSVGGQEYSEAKTLADVQNNIADFTWLVEFVRPIYESPDFDPTRKVAVIIIDNEAHGDLVLDAIAQASDALTAQYGGSAIRFERISLGSVNYAVDGVRTALANTVAQLQAEGYEDFVVNMSFAIVPCEDEVTLPTGETVTISLLDAVEAAGNETTFQNVNNILECVTDNYDGTLTAHFGYENPNDFPVYIPFGEVNFLTGGGLTNEQLRQATPQYFGRPEIVEGRPGRSQFFPNSAFQVRFDVESTLVWNLFGSTETASWGSTRCPEELETESYDEGEGDGGYEVELDVRPILECVVQLDNGDYMAHFGYENRTGFPVSTYDGVSSFLSGGGLNDARKAVSTPFYFGYPETVPDRPGRSQFYPNSAFQVIFDGSNLVWNLNGRTSTANSGSTQCVTPTGSGINDYLGDLGIPEDQYDEVVVGLLTDGATSTAPDLTDLQNLLQSYLNESATNPNFALTPVASSGNYRPWFLLAGADASPLAPARWPQTVAVGAALGEPFNFWQFSHDGNITTVGGTYIKRPTDNFYLVGTSFAAPMASLVYATYKGIEDSCQFVDVGGSVRPPAFNPDAWDNSPTSSTVPSPYNCVIPPISEEPEAPTCDGQLATLWVDENGIIQGEGRRVGHEYNGTLVGTNGSDVIVGTNGEDRINGRGGDDVICGLLGDDKINGNNGNDTLFGGSEDKGTDPSGNDIIRGGNGDDNIYGGDGDDLLRGDNGDDLIRGAAGNDRIRGGNGNDRLVGQNGMDNMHGEGGDDQMWGEAMADIMRGGPGDDIISGQGGDDTLNGGPGNDIIYSGFPNQPDIDTGNDRIRGGEGNDTVYGGDGDDNINGNEAHDILFGGEGSDVIRGGDGNDKLYGEAGNDNLNGQHGRKDELYGGDDDDILRDNDGVIEAHGGDGNDDINITLEYKVSGDAAGDVAVGADEVEVLAIMDGAPFDGISGGYGSDRVVLKTDHEIRLDITGDERDERDDPGDVLILRGCPILEGSTIIKFEEIIDRTEHAE